MIHRRLIRSKIILVASAALFLALSGCGGNPQGGSKGGSALNNAPSEVASVYKANCVNCHGTELQGRVGAVTNLQQVGSRMSAADITQQIEEGGETMPAFKDRLTANEIAGLAQWLANSK